MAPGNYGTLKLDAATASAAFARFGGEVTIRSADANRPAVLTSLDLDNVSNLTLDGVKFDLVAGSAGGFNPFSVNRSSKVTIRNGEFDGQLVDGYGVNQGLQVKHSTDITVENSKFSNFYYGAGFDEVSNLKFVGNELTGMAFDGTRFAQIVGGAIAGNHFHDMRAPGNSAHRDMIQFWTHGDTIPSSNVTIRDNVITIDDNYRVQSIFIYNEQVTRHGDGKEMYYKNFVIENNYIEGTIRTGSSSGRSTGCWCAATPSCATPATRTPGRDGTRRSRSIPWRPGSRSPATSPARSRRRVGIDRRLRQQDRPARPPADRAGRRPAAGRSAAGRHAAGRADATVAGCGHGGEQLADRDRRQRGAARAGRQRPAPRGRRARRADRRLRGRRLRVPGDLGLAFGRARRRPRRGRRACLRRRRGRRRDRVDLSAIDANALVAGDQAFVFGSAEPGGFVLIDMPSSNTLLRANTDGDARFELELIVEDAGVRASQYGAADFVL